MGRRLELRRGSARREVVFQRIEPVVPVVGERGKELLRELDWCRPQAVADSAAFARLGGHQASVGHEGQVLGDRLAGDRQARRQLGGRGRPADTRGCADLGTLVARLRA
jgi:hypothetical protein